MQRAIKLWPLIIFFSFDIREFPVIFTMTHQHKILWAINSGWGSLKPLVESRGVAKPPCRKWVSEFSDPFESLFLSHIIYYRVYLQVFICRKWVSFPCINADSWEKDVHLHFVSGTKFYNKNICHIVWVYFKQVIYLHFFSFYSSLESGGQNIYLLGDVQCRPGYLFSTLSRSRYLFAKKTASTPQIYVHSLS